MHYIPFFPVLCALLVFFTFFPGCGPDGNQGAVERVLIRVGGSTVTVREFHEAFESGITSPSVLYSDPEALRNERYQTLNRLTEELVILERARELEIEVSEEELESAVDDFRKDFPDDTFEQTLIENGISFLVWENGLKRRLLMEKVIRQDISEDSFQVPLPPNDTPTTAMDANFEAQIPADEEEVIESETDEEAFSENDSDSGIETADETENATEPEVTAEADFPRPIPENKAESDYNAWIARLKEQYTIEIDWKLWEEIEQEDIGGV